MKRRRPGIAGFTLIEVLVAILIAGLAFAVLSQAFANTLWSLSLVQAEADTQGSIRFARSQILREPDRETFEDGGELPTLDLGLCTWEAEVEETEILDLFRVQLRMEFENPEGDVQPLVVENVVHVLRPTWSDPVERSQILEEAQERLLEERADQW